MSDEGTALVTILIGFGMSVAFIVFVCTRIICAWIQNGSQNRRIHHFEPSVDLELPEYYVEEPEPESEPALLEAIPTLKFNQEAFSSIGHTQCIICLTDYKERELLRMMPECGHTFHLSCVDTWLRKQATCPVCRISLKTASETEHARHLTFSSSESFDESDTPRGNEDLQIYVVLEPTSSNSSQATSEEPEARQ